VVVRAALQHAFGAGVVGPAIVLCLVGGLVVLPTWALARHLLGVEAARLAVLLLAVMPATLLFTWASWEAVEAPMLITAAYLLTRGLMGPEVRPAWAGAGGLVLGLSTFWTYSGAFIGIALVLVVLSRRGARGWRSLVVPVAGVSLAIALLWLVVGDDVVRTYVLTRGAPEARIAARIAHHRMRNQWYWLVGGPAAWLIGAGAPVVALGARALRRVPRTRVVVAVLGPLLVFQSLPARLTSLIPGELERTWLWVYPLAAIVAAAALAPIVGRGLVEGRPRWRGLVPGLVALSLITAVVIEAFWRLPA